MMELQPNAWLVCFLCLFHAWLPARTNCGGEVESAVVTARQPNRTVVLVAARDGRVATNEVLSVVRESGFRGTLPLESLLPDSSFRLNSTRTRWLLLAINAACEPALRLDIVSSDERQGLAVTIHHEAWHEQDRRVRRSVRRLLAGTGDLSAEPHFGMQLVPTRPGVEQSAPIVVLVHGFNSDARSMEALCDHLHAPRRRFGLFVYPNDQDLRESGKLLATELGELRKEFKDARIQLVTHSMGGLVAREAIENREWGAPAVSQLIMIAPPNHGSQWARMAISMDCHEHLVAARQWPSMTSVHASVVDGLGGAARDLQPGSMFLHQLNSRERCRGVSYTILLGQQAAVTHLQVRRMQAVIEHMRSQWMGLDHPVIDGAIQCLSELEDVADRKGDGVVSLASGRLEGVKDTHVFDFSHGELLRPTLSSEAREAVELIRRRLVTEK